MAETVQYVLEQMIPELKEFEQKNVFTQNEIGAIVRQRKSFEYALARKSPKMSDFLRAIEYEMNLDTLRLRRIKRLKLSIRSSSLAYFAISKRIIYLFDRFTHHYPGDISAWTQYIRYVQSQGSRKSLVKILTRALQLHPTDSRLWILAASIEFQDNLNIIAARALMQRGLRLNPTDRNLWLEYFRMEMIYVEKLKLRRKILGLSSESNSIINKDISNNGGNDVISLRIINDNNDLDEEEMQKRRQRLLTDMKVTPDIQDEKNNPLLRGDVALAIFESAIETLPTDWKLMRDFINICLEMSTDTSFIVETILTSISEKFRLNVDARSYLCQRFIDNIQDVYSSAYIQALRKSIKEFECALENLKSPEIYEEYLDFLTRQSEKILPREETDHATLKLKAFINAIIRKTISSALQTSITSPKIITFIESQPDYGER